MRDKVNPAGLRIGVVKDWDSRWSHSLPIPADFGMVEECSPPRVIGKLRDWNNQDNRGMKNVPRKKPHHR